MPALDKVQGEAGTRYENNRQKRKPRFTGPSFDRTKKKKENIQRSRGHRFRRRRHGASRGRLPHALLEPTHKTPEWQQEPVERPRGGCRVRSSTSPGPRFRVIFIRLSCSLLGPSQQSSSINSSSLRRSRRQRRTVLRPFRATGATIGARSNLFMLGRTVTSQAKTRDL